MHLCYIDESGTSQVPGNSSHFVLAGLSIPVAKWKYCDARIRSIKEKYDLKNMEIHTAWLLRKYIEQKKIHNFSTLDYSKRRLKIENIRNRELLRLQSIGSRSYKQIKKNYQKTKDYIHLTYDERFSFVKEIATEVASWDFSRLFAECIDKLFFTSLMREHSVDVQAFEQVVSRFEIFLKNVNVHESEDYGLLIHDNNETISLKHTKLMKSFYESGTLWTNITKIIETPLFVNSQLTSMVQIADLCSYSLRRYLEKSEEDLFDLVFCRADRKAGRVVGVRHFTGNRCQCKICMSHR